MMVKTKNKTHSKSCSAISSAASSAASSATSPVASSSTGLSTSSASSQDNAEDITDSRYFKLGDYVDVKDENNQSWSVGKLVKIKKDRNLISQPSSSNNLMECDGLIYFIEYEDYEGLTEAKLPNIRPCSNDILPFSELKTGDTVLMSYNIEHPLYRGLWYDVQINKIINKRKRYVIGDITVGENIPLMKNCKFTFVDDIFKVEKCTLLEERSLEYDKVLQSMPTIKRAGPLVCIVCKDSNEKLCKDCGCKICGGKDNNDKQILCDECDGGFHMACLLPPLIELPPKDDDWYCPSCKNDENEIVRAGEQLKVPRRKSAASKSTKVWGNGMACVGRTTKCTIVPMDHFGAIPGIEVGTCWYFRVQVSEAGVHRPQIAGIHGRSTVGAFSIVLSDGYEDDVDNGEEFLYTGSGGRDLPENKRTVLKQSCDQELTRVNRALALNCNAKINDLIGATAKDWKQGKPVRVIRSCKSSKHSAFAPSVGYRYDGLYKVLKYYPQKGLSGYTIWRFVLRRDDPTPAPWTLEGQNRIAKLCLIIKYPDNYIPNETNKKRKLVPNFDSDKDNNDFKQIEVDKKIKTLYVLKEDAKKLIEADINNKKYWNDCNTYLVKGQQEFLKRVEETFSCICCQELVYEPITTKCSHNICKKCLIRSFHAEVFVCPVCRAELGKNYSLSINVQLAKALLYIFPR